MLFVSIGPRVQASDTEDLLRNAADSINRIKGGDSLYCVTFYYTPIYVESGPVVDRGDSSRDARQWFFVKINASVWKERGSLAQILPNLAGKETSTAAFCRAGFRVVDRASNSVIAIELDLVNKIAKVNGVKFFASKELEQWFTLNLLPIVRSLNQGPPIDTL